MEIQDISHLERMLLDSMRSYLRVCESGKDDEQAERIRDICSAMARLLGLLLPTDKRWNEYWWVDDVIPTSSTLLPGHQLQLEGLMIWTQKGSSKEWWVEPCSMALSEAAGAFKYQIHCGDAVRGLGKVAYDRQRRKTAHIVPEQWQFVFSK